MASATRFPELSYERIDPRCWRFVDADGSEIGPMYPTKAELLADLDRFATHYGCNPAPKPDTAPRALAPHCRSSNEDPQPFRLWAERPSYLEDPEPWKCVAAFYYLSDACDFALSTKERLILQTPADVSEYPN